MSKPAYLGLAGILLLALILGGRWLYASTTVTILSEEKVESRCSEHKSAEDCAADRLCQAVEMTPVCFDTGVCAPGGYVCTSKL